ncbi:MAG TPA: signal recognition particle-docking protein FtsY [Rhabdochlamydiaceae bacterium]|nr:signal recognition particle-docking protein FtsY [Rhabdochlamydiaceae bacterium]
MLRFIQNSYQKIKNALFKTQSLLSQRIRALFKGPRDETIFEELEKILYEADLGTALSNELVDSIRRLLRQKPEASMSEILECFKKRALEILNQEAKTSSKSAPENEPHVILIVGVNGSGKTTSIAKLAHALQKEGKKVLLAAGDTFRAAAIDQLALWAGRISVEIVKAKPGSDPSAVAFDALTAAKARGYDVVIIDTAGRLQNKEDLMQELQKLQRVCSKVIPTSPHETLLVLDATSGQNAVNQAAIFHQYTPLTGLVLAKLDGTAKGGVVLPIYQTLKIPVKWIGVGEGVDDLMPFDSEGYVNALFSDEN